MKRILCLTFALLMLVSFTACTGNKEPVDSSEDIETDAPGVKIDLTDVYTVVVSESATDTVKKLSNDLVKAINEATGVKLERITDNTKKYKETDKEILFSISKREETTTVLDKLDSCGYRIEFTNGKLVVVASNDFFLEKALQALLNTHLSFEGNSVSFLDDISVSYDGSSDMIELVGEDGKFKYQIIYPDQNENGERDLANKIRLDIQSLLDCKVELIRSDISVSNSDASYEILVGETNRTASIALYEAIGINDVTVKYSGTKLLIAAGIPQMLSDAVSAFLNDIVLQAKGTYDGRYMLEIGYTVSEQAVEWLDSVPMMSTGNYVGANDVGDDSMVFVWDNATAADYDGYITELKSNGYSEKAVYNLGVNRYMLLEGEKVTAYAYYTPSVGTVRLFVESKSRGTEYPSPIQESYTAVDNYKPTLWQVDIDTKYALSYDPSLSDSSSGGNGGMCYIMQVADGSFIIIDSGVYTDKQATIIYDILKENSTEEIPVISAWFFSHEHGDHTAGFKCFTKLYKDQVKVEAFYLNFPVNGFGHEAGHEGDGTMLSFMKQYNGAKIYRKLHTGMSFYVADARIDVICTHEDLYPVEASSANDACTVIRVTLGEQRIMFLGDTELKLGNVIKASIPASELKCDIVQYAHHGWDGPDKEVYDIIAAPTVLWSINTYSWQSDCLGENIFDRMINSPEKGSFYAVNHYIAYEAEYVKTIIIHGEGTTKLVLPYTPRENRLPDYEGIYNAIKAEEEALETNAGK